MSPCPEATYSLHNVRAVLSDVVLDDATITVEDGLIVDARQRGPRHDHSIDGHGALCLPGLVDSHSDGLEKERNPRPGVHFDHDFSLLSFEARVRATGITTIYHGVRYEGAHGGDEATVELAITTVAAIRSRRRAGHAAVDHRVLHRLDARDAEGCDALCCLLKAEEADMTLGDERPLVSFEDHTPGQGQYRDVDKYRQWMRGSGRHSPEAIETALQEWIERRGAVEGNRATNLVKLTPAAQQQRIRLLAHDPVDRDDIFHARSWGASIAEFPTTVEAAATARDAGMPTVMGAPNVLRGGSHSGNVSAEELVRLDLVTGLASDYQPSALLAAAFLLAERGACPIARAVGLVTSGPAQVVGLGDRGRIERGCRADLVLVDDHAHWPTITAIFRKPEPVPQEV